jgi:outer membrane protein insertion porin family
LTTTTATTIGRRWLLTVACAAVGCALPAAASASQPAIASVTVDSDGPVDREALLQVLGLEVGSDLDRMQLRDAIISLYASTTTDWVRIAAAETPDGLDVRVEIRHRPKVSAVSIEVRGLIARRRVAKWLEIEPGDVVSVAAVEASQRRIRRRLTDRGFSDPQVGIYLDYVRTANTVELKVDVHVGPPLSVSSVRVEGVDDPEIAAQITPKVKPGRRLTTQLEDRLRQEAETGLRKAGYWNAEVIDVARRGDGDRIELVLSVDTGERYRLHLVHPDAAAKVVAKAMPDPSREELHPQQTDALAQRMREHLQEAGFLLAEVTAELTETDDGPVLTVTADPGVVRSIAAVEFPGGRNLSSRRLESVVSVDTGRTRGLGGQDVSDHSLERDRLALLDLYRSQGFPNAEVGVPVLEPDGDDAVRIVFPIEEGLRWFVSSVRLIGVPAETAAALERTPLGIEETTPWDPRQLEVARRRLEGLLADTGYPDGRVDARVDESRPGDARIELEADPGRYVRIGDVVIAGLRRTRTSVVRRVLRRTGIEEGETFSRARMLEAQRELYELALFRRVELLPMPGQERHTDRGVVVLLEEGLHRSYVVGLGWNETDRFRVTLGWYHLNLFGGAHALSVETQLSSREQRYQLGIREPRLPVLDLPAYFVIYRTYEEFATYSQRRRGLWIDVGDRYKRPFRSWWRYEYQIVQPDAPDDVLSDLEREDQEARISSIVPTLEWDYRDNPLVPTRGTYSEVSLAYAFPLLQANAEFLKLQARTTLYGPIANGRGAVGVRLGAIQPLGADNGEPANLRIPLNTRFFAGGATTHRAFRRDYLGIPGQTINDDGDPIGGNALVLINAEYVRPLSRLFSAHLFVDSGNVWERPSAVRFQDFRWGAGLGFSFDTPAGPIRLEYGWKLDREPDESPGQWWLSFGIPF